METEASTLDLQPGEVILSVGNDKRRPVQKWSGASVWPGRLTVTDRALYFEVSTPSESLFCIFPFGCFFQSLMLACNSFQANNLTGHNSPVRLDLTSRDTVISTRKVGPFGVEVFDSGISVASSPE